MNRERPDAILMVSDSLTLSNRRRVFEYAAERRLPAIYETDSMFSGERSSASARICTTLANAALRTLLLRFRVRLCRRQAGRRMRCRASWSA